MVLKVLLLSKEIEKILCRVEVAQDKALSRGSLNLDPDPSFIYAGFDATAMHGDNF